MKALITRCLLGLSIILLSMGSGGAVPGDLDFGFGQDGIAFVPTVLDGDQGRAVAVQSDAKIVVLGTAHERTGGAEFVLARFNIDGTLDNAFGTAGVATVAFDQSSQASALAIQSDGKIVVAGVSQSSNLSAAPSAALARFTSGGLLDPTFGQGGKATASIGAGGAISGLAIQGGGQILVGGTVLFNGTNSDFLLIRFTSSGALDHCFGSTFCLNLSGSVHTDFGGQDQAFAVALQGDGKIVAAGCTQTTIGSESRFAIARYNANGLIDSTFGAFGRVTTDFSASDDGCSAALQPETALSIAQQADGKLVIAGSTVDPQQLRPSVPIIARYNTNGSLDTTFGNGGKAVTEFGDAAHGVVIQPDGRIVVAAGETPYGDCCNSSLARFNANGSVDTTFGQGGVASGYSGESALGLALEQVLLDGKLLVVGDAISAGLISLTRFQAFTVPLTKVGTFALAPADSTASVNQHFDYAFTWTVPDPENWHDLKMLQLRLRDGSDVILSVTFDEASNTFSILNAAGNAGPSAVPGSSQVLQTREAALYMAEAKAIASGPTSPTVTLLLPLSLKPQTAGRSFVVEVAATDDFGTQSGFVQAGTLDVQPSR